MSRGRVRKLALAEVFTDATGMYACQVENNDGCTMSICHVTLRGIVRGQGQVATKYKPKATNHCLLIFRRKSGCY